MWTQPDTSKEFLTIREAAKVASISYRRMGELVRAGKVPLYRFVGSSRNIRIRKSDLFIKLDRPPKE